MTLRVLLFLLASCSLGSAFGQAPTRAPFAGRRAADQPQPDSLERVFNQAPPYVRVSYRHNGQSVPWSRALTFYVEQAAQPRMLEPVRDNAYLLPALVGDSLTVGIALETTQLAFASLPARLFVHGGTLDFGVVDRAHWKRIARASGEWSPEQAALQSLDVAAWRRTRGLRRLHYLVIRPRVYGDGTIQTICRPVFRQH